MKKEVNPLETSRSSAFKLWMSSPMPMVTLVKTINVSRQVLQSHGDVGEISQRMAEDYTPCIIPVPSCADGWRTRGGVLEYIAKYD